MMPLDRSFIEQNRASTNRIRALVTHSSEEDLKQPVWEHWTISIVLAHLAFWDRRVLILLDETEGSGKLSAHEIDVIANDILLPFFAAIPSREAARITLETAETLDKRLEAYPSPLLEEIYEFNKRWILRSLHRNEHLDEVEAALKR